jgi:hypothetical protein
MEDAIKMASADPKAPASRHALDVLDVTVSSL